MSGIAAIVRFDGGEVELGAIERMTQAMAYRGPDGIAHWRKGRVALGHLMLRTTAESLEEVQPLTNEDESLVLIMDGWLSNWEELRHDLLARGAALRTRSDAELVLRAYETWGEDCPRHIDGSYGLAIWDAHRQEVFLARDYFGQTALHYHWDGACLVLASDIAGVAAGPNVQLVPNRAVIAERMASTSLTPDETIWQGVMRCKPAHWMRIGRGGIATGQHWSPRLDVQLNYRADEDYFVHYRELFADCVRRASRSHLPLACEVSGGLDSSAVFAMARHLQCARRLEAPDLIGFTHRFAERGTPMDEIDYARAVASHVGAPLREVDQTIPDRSWFEARARADRDLAPFPVESLAGQLGEAAVTDGCRVALNGFGGDELLEGSQFYYAEMIQAGDLHRLVRRLVDDAGDVGWFRALGWSLKYGLLNFAPRVLRDRIFKNARYSGRIGFNELTWLQPDLREQLQRRDQIDQSNRNDSREWPAKAHILDVLTTLNNWIGQDHESRTRARSGFEGRSPMQTRPFIEFAFAIPERLRCQGTTSKIIHRRALRGLVPEIITTRTTKGEYSATFAHLLDDMQDLIVNQLPENDSSFLVKDGLETLYNSYLARRTGYPVWQLWGIFGTAAALRMTQGGKLADRRS